MRISRQVLYGVAILLVVVPGLLLGVSAADAGGAWPPLSDLRYILIVAGLVALVVLWSSDRPRGTR